MSLTVGTDAYVSLAACDAYHTALGNTAWTGLDAAKEAAIRKATMWIDNAYRGRWKGIRCASTQPLAWPRWDVTDEDGLYVDPATIPTAISNATCEAALRIIGGTDLDPDIDRGGQIKSESVGSLSVTYMDGAPSGTKFNRIDRMLSGLMGSRGNPRIERG
jgi:hypothetical protein